jgi:SAM-dependent methyltransferase
MRFYKNHIELPHEAVLLFNKISNLFNLEKAEAESLFPAYFIYYHRGYFSGEWNFERHVHYFYDIFQVTEAQEARVLDVGCGFGLLSIFFETFGAAEVTGIDLDTEKICGFKSLLKFVNMEDGHVKLELGDALNTGFSDRTFDVIIVNDVLSHVSELEKFLEEISRLLVPGGRLYLYDDNNKLFLPNMFEHRRLWKRCEKGPLDILTLRGTDEHLPYAEIRKKMILNLEPYCSPSNLEYVVKKTAGMYGKELESAVAEFRMTGKIKKHKGFKYRNPKTGEFPERPLNPYMISKALRNRGFSSRALPTFFFVKSIGLKGSIKKVLSLIFRMIPSLSFIIAPSFRILSMKTKA